jgi:hypothetical protein
MADAGSLLTSSPDLLFEFLNYEKRYPDFPTNITSLLALQNEDTVQPYLSSVKGAVIALPIVTTFVFAARIWTRRWYQRVPLWWDDHMASLSLLLVWAQTVLLLLSISIGKAGQHSVSQSFDTLMQSLKFEVTTQILYGLCACIIKFSICLFIFRLTPPSSKVMRMVLYGTMVFLFLQFISQFLVTMFGCRPYAATWDLKVRLATQNCVDVYKYVLAFASMWTITDAWILMLPIPLVWRLDATIQRKVATWMLFALGALVCVASALKIKYIGGIYNTWDPCCM